MSIVGIILSLLTVIGAFIITRPLVDLIIPQEEIDNIDAIGEWAKEELDRREHDMRGDSEWQLQ